MEPIKVELKKPVLTQKQKLLNKSKYMDMVIKNTPIFNGSKVPKKLVGMGIYTWGDLWHSKFTAKELLMRPGIGHRTIKKLNKIGKLCGVPKL